MGFALRKRSLDVGIVTNDADRMLAFYRDTLGLPALDPLSFGAHGTVHRLCVGESILRLFQPGTPAPERGGPNDSTAASTGVRYLTLVWDDVDEVVRACEAFGVHVSGPVREIRPGVRATTIQDPDGNWIEVQSLS
ncbi:MAG TPA: VOC family protein [Acidimicrobiales bacterium]|nr:VOC family protein [Acidimicrobiales bacterium]